MTKTVSTQELLLSNFLWDIYGIVLIRVNKTGSGDKVEETRNCYSICFDLRGGMWYLYASSSFLNLFCDCYQNKIDILFFPSIFLSCYY